MEARYRWEEQVSYRYAPHRYLGYYPTPNHENLANRHSALGFRGEDVEIPKPVAEFRIACIGGSTTYGSHTRDYKETYPYLLEQELKSRGHTVTVVNAGVEGWTSYESLVSLAFRVIDVEPDLIIVYHTVNDMVGRLVYPVEAYRGDNSGSRGPYITERFMPSILEYSTVLRVAMIRSGLTLPHSALPNLYDVFQPTFVGNEWRTHSQAGGAPSGVFDTVDLETIIRSNPPQYFKRNLENMQAMAAQHGIATVLSTFAYSPAFEHEPFVASPEFAQLYGEGEAALRGVVEATDAALFDFAATFPEDPALFTDGIHLTTEGATIKAGLFADFLEESGLVAVSAAQ